MSKPSSRRPSQNNTPIHSATNRRRNTLENSTDQDPLLLSGRESSSVRVPLQSDQIASLLKLGDGFALTFTPQNSAPASPLTVPNRRQSGPSAFPDSASPRAKSRPTDAAGHTLPLGITNKAKEEKGGPLEIHTPPPPPPLEACQAGEDSMEVTVNNNSFLDFKKRKSYAEEPLIPTEVYQTPTGKGENMVFVSEPHKKVKFSPSTKNPPEEYPVRAPDPSSGTHFMPTVVQVPNEPQGEDAVASMTGAPVLIYPKKIDNMYRFRILFAGLCLFVVSSLQGLHALFGLMLLDKMFKYSLTESINIYTCGAAFGMFVFPFGVLYDFFGPRPGIAIATAMMIAAEVCLALAFKGTITPTPTKIAIFYALMSWGCYTLDVTVLPAVLTHMPRDRGQPTGLLKTFSGLGASFISCLYRGFFTSVGNKLNDPFSALMWFCLALTALVGLVCIWYMHDAPYVVTRAEQFMAKRVVKKKINKEKKEYTPDEVEKNETAFNELLKLRLKKYLIRNRYMAQLMPKRRYNIVTIILVLLNFYLTIQAICAAFFADEMTPGKYRGIAIGAIVIVVLLVILVIPIRAIDEPSPQDEEVVGKAKAQEQKLREKKEERLLEEYKSEKRERRRSERLTSTQNVGNADDDDEDDVVYLEPDSAVRRERLTATEDSATRRKMKDSKENSMVVKNVTNIDRETTLMELEVDDISAGFSRTTRTGNGNPLDLSVGPGGLLSLSTSDNYSYYDDSVPNPAAIALSASLRYTNSRQTSDYPENPLSGGNELQQESSGTLQVVAQPSSSYDNPYIESINVCGEMFVAPVYRSSFLKSLTYIDIYLLGYTTLVMWGIGLTTTANYNIYIMLMARDLKMDYKMYILFSAMSGVFVAGGRVFIGVWERITMILKQKKGIYITATAVYPVCSILMLIGTVLWAALPGKYILVMSYLFTSAAYGASTSVTPYVITAIFEKDIGTHYGFCFLGAAIGMVIFYRVLFYELYLKEAIEYPPQLGFVGKRCIGKRVCLNNTLIAYNLFTASAVVTSFWLHFRYKQLVTGKVSAPKRIFFPVLKRIFCCSCCKKDTAAS
ncbi:Major Facilitator Superfamily, putative [Angomonas deanei]|uniref:Major Facilitator Superfamily, putative n=1 Tax=Angomonas deanei TaxID=59799 RepID=A0A7G2C2F3_9TRYP|nr:Major Facilitator Superfamily, putative [Angomonas deanei]